MFFSMFSYCSGHAGVQEEDETVEGEDVGRCYQVHHGGRLPDRDQHDGDHLHQDRDHQPRRVQFGEGEDRGRGEPGSEQEIRNSGNYRRNSDSEEEA